MKKTWTMTSLAAASAALLLAGCDFPQREATLIDASKVATKPGMVTMPGELRAAYLAGTTSEAVLRYCAEPAPDTAAQAALKVASAVEASAKSTSAAEGSAKLSNSVDYAVTILELSGRTQTVLLTRELAYRVCEARLNGSIDGPQARELLNEVIKVSVSLAQAEKSKADAKVATSVSEATQTLFSRATGCGDNAATCLEKAKDESAKKKCEEDKQVCLKTVKAGQDALGTLGPPGANPPATPGTNPPASPTPPPPAPAATAPAAPAAATPSPARPRR